MPPVRTPAEMLKIAMTKTAARTGTDFDGWVEIARGSGIATHKALTQWLKDNHDLNHNEAQWVAWGVLDPGRMDQYDRPADLVAELYVDKKAHLRPIYDRLMETGLALGPEVTSFVCKGYTSLSSGTQFVIFAPRTNGAIDVELVLPEGHAAGEALKSSNPKFNRRFRVKSLEDLSPDLNAAIAAARAYVRG